MWEIDPVARLRPRLTNVYWPLLTRACLIALCGLVTAISPKLGPRIAVAPALLLLLVAALGTLPVPRTVPVWLQPLMETLAAALVVGALQAQANLFLPYVLVPLTTAGLAAGLGVALVAAGLASLVILLTALLADPTLPVLDALLPHDQDGGSWTWVLIFVAVSVVSAWMRRVSATGSTSPDPAYTDAHRLLSELHVVARQLSLGLTRRPSRPRSPTSCAIWSTESTPRCS
jgi:hypothetical protein